MEIGERSHVDSVDEHVRLYKWGTVVGIDHLSAIDRVSEMYLNLADMWCMGYGILGSKSGGSASRIDQRWRHR